MGRPLRLVSPYIPRGTTERMGDSSALLYSSYGRDSDTNA